VKLKNVVVTCFVERCNLVREGKLFVKDKAKVSSRVGGFKCRVVYFGKLVNYVQCCVLLCILGLGLVTVIANNLRAKFCADRSNFCRDLTDF